MNICTFITFIAIQYENLALIASVHLPLISTLDQNEHMSKYVIGFFTFNTNSTLLCFKLKKATISAKSSLLQALCLG